MTTLVTTIMMITVTLPVTSYSPASLVCGPEPGASWSLRLPEPSESDSAAHWARAKPNAASSSSKQSASGQCINMQNMQSQKLMHILHIYFIFKLFFHICAYFSADILPHMICYVRVFVLELHQYKLNAKTRENIILLFSSLKKEGSCVCVCVCVCVTVCHSVCVTVCVCVCLHLHRHTCINLDSPHGNCKFCKDMLNM